MAMPHPINGRHDRQDSKLSQAAATVGIDLSAWDQGPVSSGCGERGRAQHVVREVWAGAASRAPR
ncbi:hypothetical protein GCM10010215_19990 [Streptomyces virginiae]|uniref:Uncharacterized protein n=1 Tax=Streptomyces virginiae TaxID=1961 RepID=A0ABQ3NQW7_STRVG|nr:hypothetical protein GCM10010215_19990 [Streptomyces virginiae]GHI15122.1 hypothetical protein Scinn_45850 [Streptomyces virginiae]GLV92297.1 hypothetical protein Slala04_37510 [Streptomyces lavendulae subsp. lavendulae]